MGEGIGILPGGWLWESDTRTCGSNLRFWRGRSHHIPSSTKYLHLIVPANHRAREAWWRRRFALSSISISDILPQIPDPIIHSAGEHAVPATLAGPARHKHRESIVRIITATPNADTVEIGGCALFQQLSGAFRSLWKQIVPSE